MELQVNLDLAGVPQHDFPHLTTSSDSLGVLNINRAGLGPCDTMTITL
jgi:hypothetical protein